MSQPKNLFYDRRGVLVTPQAHSVIRPRRGVWAVAASADSLLVLWPGIAGRVPDLPGGGIEEGETPEQAISREWFEETGLPFTPVSGPHETYNHVRGFYAEGPDEYWVYDQTFFLYRFDRRQEIGHKWRNPEGDPAGWLSFDDVATSLNRAHWLAIESLLPDIKNLGKN